ncbi:MAG: tyrosine-type recombinase/integrase, partial [Actinomycetota bacterium]
MNDSITFYDLRHFFASVLIASGCSIKQVQMALGHDSARITLDTYAGLTGSPSKPLMRQRGRRQDPTRPQVPRPGGFSAANSVA